MASELSKIKKEVKTLEKFIKNDSEGLNFVESVKVKKEKTKD